MDLKQRLSISYYKTIANINEAHKIFLVQHQETGDFYVKKILDVYSIEVYSHLKAHPITGIPKIIDFVEDNNSLIVIEEYISGSTLQERIESNPLTKEQIIDYMTKLCTILDKLHSQKPPIVHRDIKPSNIIITNTENIILLDFNAAKFNSENDNKTSDTVLLGTQGFAAPEQYGFQESSPLTDIYSVGILIRLLVQKLPDGGKSFKSIISKCTQIDPKNRFSSVKELRAALLRKLPFKALFDKSNIQLFPYFPPGFRTMKPWKMIIATLWYVLIFNLAQILEIKNTTPVSITIDRILYFLTLVIITLIGCNYMNLLDNMPICNSSNKLIKLLGRVLYIVVIFSIMFFTMTLINFILAQNGI